MWKSWQKVLSKSEKLVNCSSSFINIRYLLTDEITSIVKPVRKLIGSSHPITKTARNIIDGDRGVGQLRGLMLLLISKSFNSPLISLNKNQKSLSEILETAYAAINIHRGIVDVNNDEKTQEWREDMKFGNKMATLCGDYLLAAVSRALADLQNTKIVDEVSQGIGDTVISNFKLKTIDNYENYKNMSFLSSGSLFSNCCRSSISIKSDASEYSDSDLKALETKINEWSVNWAELYSICSDINDLANSLSNNQIKSSIFTSNSSLDQNMVHEELTIQSLRSSIDILDQITDNLTLRQKYLLSLSSDQTCATLLQEITDILYDDAKLTSRALLNAS